MKRTFLRKAYTGQVQNDVLVFFIGIVLSRLWHAFPAATSSTGRNFHTAFGFQRTASTHTSRSVSRKWALAGDTFCRYRRCALYTEADDDAVARPTRADDEEEDDEATDGGPG